MSRRCFVLDASVAAAWYLPEEFSDEARRWQRRALDGEIDLLVPSLHYWEIGNVLRTYVKRAELTADLAKEIFEIHLEAPLRVEEPDTHLVLETAFDFDATVYDAVYITLSRTLDAPILTAERTTTPWVKRLGAGAQIVRA
jgi:predicted nucleic acid-binding protein